MQYTFSWGAFFIGTLILLGGAALTAWYRPIADNMGSGVGSYDRYRMWGLIAVGVGFIVMLNIHSLILSALFNALFNRG